MTVTNGYADATDVQALLNSIGGIAALTLGVASVPTLAQAEAWTDEYAAIVDSHLRGAGYGTVPATGTNDVIVIGHYVAQRAAARAWNAAVPADEPLYKVDLWIKEWNAFLKGLDEKTMRLIDQAPRSGLHVIYAARYTED